MVPTSASPTAQASGAVAGASNCNRGVAAKGDGDGKVKFDDNAKKGCKSTNVELLFEDCNEV